MKRLAAACLFLAQCARHGEPASEPLQAPRAAQPSAAPEHGPLAVQGPREREHPVQQEPQEVEFTPFGRVVVMEERRPLSAFVPVDDAPPPPPARYERWREKRRATIGYGYLSILDLTRDERFLLVASEDEAKLRTYAFPSLKAVASVVVAGYERFGAGDFVFDPVVSGPPAALFASDRGIDRVDTQTGAARPLSELAAHSLRFTDDHRVLGATVSAIPVQRSGIVFYGVSPEGTLEPALSLVLSERVEEWDLDSEKKRLAVVYYPSDQIEVIDLVGRRVLWTAPVPQYSNSVDISPDNRRVAVGGASVVLYDFDTGRPIAEDRHFGNNIHRVRFSPSGDGLAVSSYEGKIRIFDPTGPGPGLPLRKLLRHSGTANVYALVFNRDGSALVSGSGDQTVRVWGE